MAFKNIALGALTILMAFTAPAVAGDKSRGEQIFQLCAQCHTKEATGNSTLGAPSIAGLDPWYIEAQLQKFQAGIRGTHPEDLPGLRMRPMALTLLGESDVEDVASYIASLAATKPAQLLSGGDTTKGAEYFKVCLACHGPAAAGNQQLNAPRLSLANDWYLFSQLENFRQGRRGVDPRDTNGMLMRPMSLTLPDEQALKDVIAYIMTLSK